MSPTCCGPVLLSMPLGQLSTPRAKGEMMLASNDGWATKEKAGLDGMRSGLDLAAMNSGVERESSWGDAKEWGQNIGGNFLGPWNKASQTICKPGTSRRGRCVNRFTQLLVP